MKGGGGGRALPMETGRAIRYSMEVIRGSMPFIMTGITNEAQINRTLGFVAELEMV